MAVDGQWPGKEWRDVRELEGKALLGRHDFLMKSFLVAVFVLVVAAVAEVFVLGANLYDEAKTSHATVGLYAWKLVCTVCMKVKQTNRHRRLIISSV